MSDTTSTNVQSIGPKPDDAPTRPTAVANAAEYAAIAHVRGWVHYSPICPVCIAWESGRLFGKRRAIDEIASGS